MSHPPKLSGSVRDSFAYITIKDRLPKILGKVVDSLSKLLLSGCQNESQVKLLIQQIGELRYNLTRDKPLPGSNDPIWKAGLDDIPLDERTWFKAPWLFIECYLYYLLYHYKTNLGLDIDLFAESKNDSLVHSIGPMQTVIQELKSIQEPLEYLLLVSLWGNEADLSFSGGGCSTNQTTSSNHQIIVNDTQAIIKQLEKSTKVTIILDNSGFELFSDLLLAHYLVKQGESVVLYYKPYEWFVSDATFSDIQKLFDVMNTQGMQDLVNEWKELITNGKWVLKTELFWNAWYDYSCIPDTIKCDFGSLVIMKGDLNYRKMMGDLDWPPQTSLVEAARCKDVQVVMIRTCKSGCVAGVCLDQVKQLDLLDPKWKENGKFGMIQLFSPKS